MRAPLKIGFSNVLCVVTVIDRQILGAYAAAFFAFAGLAGSLAVSCRSAGGRLGRHYPYSFISNNFGKIISIAPA